MEAKSAGTKPSVLILATSDADFATYSLALAASFKVLRLELNADTLVTIQRSHADVVVLDYDDPVLSPLQLAYQLRVHPNPKTYAALVLVDHTRVTVREPDASFGVEVFCSKAEAQHQLRALVKNALRIRTTLQEMSLLNRQHGGVGERLKKLSLTDDQTGLYNMLFMTRLLHSEFQRAERYQKHLSLLLVEVDHFRSLSQTSDPLEAEQLITRIGQEIGDGLRFEVDYAARSGFESFLLLLPETKGEGSYIVAERLRARISRVPTGSIPGPLTLSIGLAHYDGSAPHLRRSADLLHSAESGLQRAKDEGRNRVSNSSDRPALARVC